ncbi:single-stranded DNA-binding protein [Achromobacter mucicolens]|uniref:ERF family protein n=1 Tax=Achromobacter mucicolens TaxID=1389922 RepID=UPI000D4EEA69|nr:ERF family protein [Achromobacter mucicolens]MCP2516785.1 ERF family protein [Achromobacter mucicolens]PTW84011.1 single-stranded DNA-binding protein [Achromobacter mucicolens]UAN04410.1 ERF family protein [Achromobacter mucicolens]WBX91600.1 ERF family protein [Achromobacter mucicolens]
MTEVIDAPARAVAMQPEQAAGQVAGPAANSPIGMMMAAVQQGIPLDQIKEMMAIQREWEAGEARKAFNDAFAAFKSEAVEIIKRKQVEFKTDRGTTSYKHAELSDVVTAVGPALSKHGFAWGWDVEQKDGRIHVTCTLVHRLGHEKSVTLSAPPDESGKKNTIQAIASTTTYLERHTLKAVCGISEKGDDNDGAGADDAALGLRDEWISKLAQADSMDAAAVIWQDGCKAIEATNNLAAFAAFKKAYADKRAMLKQEKQ